MLFQPQHHLQTAAPRAAAHALVRSVCAHSASLLQPQGKQQRQRNPSPSTWQQCQQRTSTAPTCRAHPINNVTTRAWKAQHLWKAHMYIPCTSTHPLWMHLKAHFINNRHHMAEHAKLRSFLTLEPHVHAMYKHTSKNPWIRQSFSVTQQQPHTHRQEVSRCLPNVQTAALAVTVTGPGHGHAGPRAHFWSQCNPSQAVQI